MHYITESEAFIHAGKSIHAIQQAAELANGMLRVHLSNGSSIEGKFEGIHCTPNAKQSLAFAVDLTQDDGDYVHVVDLLDISEVQAL